MSACVCMCMRLPVLLLGSNYYSVYACTVQLIAESYDLLARVGGMNNEELAKMFTAWNKTELESFLIEITAKIFTKKDEDGKNYVVDKVLDKV